LKEINPRRSASKAPKSESKKRNLKGKCVSPISNDDDLQTKDVIMKKKERKGEDDLSKNMNFSYNTWLMIFVIK